MIQDFVDLFKNIALRHKLVRTFRYQDKVLNNSQNNFKTFQVYMDTVSLHQLNITTKIFTSEFELYILSQPDGTSGNTVLDIQNNAYTIACDIIAFIEGSEEYDGVLSILDYSLLTLSEYTDDRSAGIKLSLRLQMPNPVNLCTLQDNFDDEPHEEEQDKEIDISGSTASEDLTITPIHLRRTRNC